MQEIQISNKILDTILNKQVDDLEEKGQKIHSLKQTNKQISATAGFDSSLEQYEAEVYDQAEKNRRKRKNAKKKVILKTEYADTDIDAEVSATKYVYPIKSGIHTHPKFNVSRAMKGMQGFNFLNDNKLQVSYGPPPQQQQQQQQPLGMIVGATVGTTVGLTVGNTVGTTVGPKVGLTIGNSFNMHESTSTYTQKKSSNYSPGKYRCVKKTHSSIGEDRNSGKQYDILEGIVVNVEKVQTVGDRIRGQLKIDKSWISIAKVDGSNKIFFEPVQTTVNYSPGKYRCVQSTHNSIGEDRKSAKTFDIPEGMVVTVEKVQTYGDRIRGQLKVDKSWISIAKLDGSNAIFFEPVQTTVTRNDGDNEIENNVFTHQKSNPKRKLIDIDEHPNQTYYTIESILMERTVNDQNGNLLHQYLVKWFGYDKRFDSWEPVDELRGKEAEINYRVRKEGATLEKIMSVKGIYHNNGSVPVYKLEWQDTTGKRFYTRELFENNTTLTRKQWKKFDHLIQEYSGIYQKKI